MFPRWHIGAITWLSNVELCNRESQIITRKTRRTSLFTSQFMMSTLIALNFPVPTKVATSDQPLWLPVTSHFWPVVIRWPPYTRTTICTYPVLLRNTMRNKIPLSRNPIRNFTRWEYSVHVRKLTYLTFYSCTEYDVTLFDFPHWKSSFQWFPFITDICV